MSICVRAVSGAGWQWLAGGLGCCLMVHAAAPTPPTTNRVVVPPPTAAVAPGTPAGPGDTDSVARRLVQRRAPESAVSPAAEPADPQDATDATSAEDGGSEAQPAAAQAPESPYQAIAVLNVFRLHDAPPAPPPPDPNPQVTPSALKLTGITTVFAGKRAMFVLQEPGKPQLVSDLVKEGEKDGVITNLEVLSIDERAEVVRVNYGGKELALNFRENGLKAPAGPPPGIVPPGLARPGGVPIVPPITAGGAAGVQPPFANQTSPAASSGLSRVPRRPSRMPSGNEYMFGSSYGVNPGDQAQTAQEVVQPVIPPDQQAAIMRAQEAISRQQGIPFPPALPGAGATQAGQVPAGMPGGIPLPPTPGVPAR